ncbi:hypothetical protein [Aquipseudomonas alcaligenes]
MRHPSPSRRPVQVRMVPSGGSTSEEVLIDYPPAIAEPTSTP